jgi:hypothetical protein
MYGKTVLTGRLRTQCRPEWYMSCFAFRDMGESYHVLKTALRVISAINEKRGSDPADIERLKAIAGPKPNDVTTDKFTCDVIKKAIDGRVAASTTIEKDGVIRANGPKC